MKSLIYLTVLLAGCAAIGDTPPPADFPHLRVIEHYVSEGEMYDRCSKYVAMPRACAEFYFAQNECHIWYSKDWPPLRFMVEHEREHCAGFDHFGSTAIADLWNRYKQAHR